MGRSQLEYALVAVSSRCLVCALAGVFFAAISPLKGAVVLTVPVSAPTVANDFFAPPIELDFDRNGVVDIVIPGGSTQINVRPESPNRVLAVFEQGSHFSENLAEGSFIGASPENPLVWREGAVMSACANAGGVVCFGNFLGGIDYLGVEFDIAGNTHYGWVEVESLDFTHFVRALRWAYETEPGVPIRAGQIPEPSALGLLLVGSVVVVTFSRQIQRSRR